MIFLTSRQSELVSNSGVELCVNLTLKNSSQLQLFSSVKGLYSRRLSESERVCSVYAVHFHSFITTYNWNSVPRRLRLLYRFVHWVFFRKKGRKKGRLKYSSNGCNYWTSRLHGLPNKRLITPSLLSSCLQGLWQACRTRMSPFIFIFFKLLCDDICFTPLVSKLDF